MVLFSSVGQAGASVAGRLLGAGRDDELPLTYMALLAFNLAVGAVVSALLFLLHPYIPGWLGLAGETADDATAAAAAEAPVEGLTPAGDLHASPATRLALARTYARRAIGLAISRAQNER